MINRMALQGAEFEALKELIKRYHALPSVVDDTYPECRRCYEIALMTFIQALRNNGRKLNDNNPPLQMG